MAKTIKNKIVYEENINNIKGKALAIIFPETLQEIKNLVKLSKHDIIPRGNGSSFVGSVAPKNSVIVDFSKMNKIIQIDPDKKTAIVEPGVLLTELNETLEPYGLMFPIEPIFPIDTLGGIIAKNSSGNREIKYNRPINWINSLEVINSKGEQIKASKSDLSDFVGMEGITGIIVRANIRLTTLKRRTISILRSDKTVDMINASKRLKLDAEVSAVDLVSKEISSFLGLANRHHLFVEYESDKGNFKNEDYEKFMKLKNRAYKKAAIEGFYHIESIKFLMDSLQDFLFYLEEKRIPFFSHMASGVIYPLFRTDEREKQKLEDALKFARRLRGRIGYTLGVGLTKKELLEFGESALIKRIKNRLDSGNKFNRDKLISHKLAEISAEKAEKLEEINKEKQEREQEEKIIEEKEEIVKEIQQETTKNIEEKQGEEIKETIAEEPVEEQAEETSEIAQEIIEEVKEEPEKPEENPEEPNKQEEKKNIEKKSEEKVLTVGDLLKQSEELALKKPESELESEAASEEHDKIKKIAAGFFAGGRDTDKNGEE